MSGMPLRKARPFCFPKVQTTSLALATIGHSSVTTTNGINRPIFASTPVRHELHQRAVGVAEVDAGPLAPRAEARHRSRFDRDVVRFQMRDRALDRPVPLKAQIA